MPEVALPDFGTSFAGYWSGDDSKRGRDTKQGEDDDDDLSTPRDGDEGKPLLGNAKAKAGNRQRSQNALETIREKARNDNTKRQASMDDEETSPGGGYFDNWALPTGDWGIDSNSLWGSTPSQTGSEKREKRERR